MTQIVRFQKLDDRAVAPAYGSAAAAGADLYAVADAPITIGAGQTVLVPYLTAAYQQADSLTDTVRGDGGFGSTGTK